MSSDVKVRLLQRALALRTVKRSHKAYDIELDEAAATRIAALEEFVRKVAWELLSTECGPSELAIADFREAHDAHVLDARALLGDTNV